MRPLRSVRRTGAWLALVGLAATLVVGLAAMPAGAATEGRIVRAEFRDCQVVRVVYADVEPGTIVTWQVSQFGRTVDRGAFLVEPGPAATPRTLTIRLRAPVEAGTDAAFVLDEIGAVRRKPRCAPTDPTLASGPTTTPPTTVAPTTTGAGTASGEPGSQPSATLPDEVADTVTGPESEERGSFLASGVAAAIVIIIAVSAGFGALALARRPNPNLPPAPERPLPPWLHTPVPKKRGWFRKG
ncbi:MAG: hypothetical protein ACKO1Y_01225 [Actinomycetota bacterium]